MNNPTYMTQPGMMGGVWRLWHQEGMPLEMTYLHLKSKGIQVDWMEAMADASLDNNLPSLANQLLTFMPREEVDAIFARLMVLKDSGLTYQAILDSKRKNALPLAQAAI